MGCGRAGRRSTCGGRSHSAGAHGPARGGSARALDQQGIAEVDSAGRHRSQMRVEDFGGEGIISEIEILRGDLADLVVADGRARGNGAMLVGALVVRGVGFSGTTMAVMVGAYRGLRPEQIPHASSTTRIVQQLGGSFGTAVLAGPGSAAMAFGPTFVWALAFTAIAAIPALLLPRLTSGEPVNGPAPR